MTRRIGWLLAAALLCAVPASAEDLMFFTNGTSMPIRSWELKDGMYHVDLGGDGFIAFPEYMVEKIEQADGSVRLPRSTKKPGSAPTAPRIAASGPKGDANARADERTQQVLLGRGQQAPLDKPQPTDRFGLAAQRPMAGSAHPMKSQLTVTGRQQRGGSQGRDRVAPGSLRGARRVGNQQVIDAPGVKGGGHQNAVGLTKKGN